MDSVVMMKTFWSCVDEAWKCLLGALKVSECLQFGVQSRALCTTVRSHGTAELSASGWQVRPSLHFESARFWTDTGTSLAVQMKGSQIQKPWGQDSPHQFQHPGPLAVCSAPLLVEREAEVLPPASLHKRCGSRVLVLVVSTNLLMDVSLLMWLVFLIATAVCQAH